jgi:hypothetical protein
VIRKVAVLEENKEKNISLKNFECKTTIYLGFLTQSNINSLSLSIEYLEEI